MGVRLWMRADIHHVDDLSAFVHAIPQAIAGGEIILPHARQLAFQAFHLAWDALGRMVAEMLINELPGILGGVTGNALEGVTGVPLQDHVIG